ncbi:MAG TPA: Spy/CpxP family protein refolding chaperone [Longimicrobiales bacterium]
MRKMLWMLAAVVTLAACSEETTAPTDEVLLLEDAASLAYGAMDMADPGSRFIARLNSLPDSIKLSTAQIEQIRALVSAYKTSIADDLRALAAIHQEARAAHQAGKPPAEIRAILARGDAIRASLHAAEARLHANILALLTPAQIAWLRGHRPCSDVRLTDEQKTQITALIAAFETAHEADLNAIKAVFEEARAARQAGATREQIGAILQKARAPMERVRAAQRQLDADIRALLTPAQLACFGGIRR